MRLAYLLLLPLASPFTSLSLSGVYSKKDCAVPTVTNGRYFIPGPLKLSSSSRAESDDPSLSLLSLDSIRSTLIRQEETIIFGIIERSQFSQNSAIYDSKSPLSRASLPPGASGPDRPLSFLDYMLIGTEVLHSSVRRYTSPDEHPFHGDVLPSPILPKLSFPEDLLSSEGEACTQ